ncbi:hypothetical protein C1645_819569 [Glomus cerebriforme]|uniref:Aspartic peptidase DDI1-type domain-containing protein n=1 Tax=Glomus cerebriforme TaxID=658196 RepID=A0A397T5Y2_9GLOM|nr:hypothetical protein C1645_819569 [Glomus cerebriforme]
MPLLNVLLRNHLQVTNASSAEDLDTIPKTALERRKRQAKKGKVNLTTVDSDSYSGTSSNTSSSDSFDFDISSSDFSDSEKIFSAMLREIPLEEIIHKILLSEFKLIFPAHFSQDSKEKSLDDPMEIYFIQKRELKTSVMTVKCKIKHLKIPAMTVDSGAEPPIITENIVEHVGAKINKSETHNLNYFYYYSDKKTIKFMTVPVESVGVIHNLPITLALAIIQHLKKCPNFLDKTDEKVQKEIFGILQPNISNLIPQKRKFSEFQSSLPSVSSHKIINHSSYYRPMDNKRTF